MAGSLLPERKKPSLWDAAGQYVRDAMPGGSLNPEVTPQGVLDTAALASAPVPIVGDLLGVAADANRMRDPNERTLGNFGLMALGALPLVPSLMAGAGLVKGSRGAKAFTNQDGAIKAFHGSPHKFDRFDLSKIGTGEGAQVYGHGLYFADNPAVARSYAEANSKSSLYIGKNRINLDELDEHTASAARSIAAQGWENAKKAVQQMLDGGANPEWVRKYEAAIDQFQAAPPRWVNDQAQMYEASLRWPDAAREASDPMGPQHFLDYDSPLSEQPAAIQDSVRKAFDALFFDRGKANYDAAVEQGMTAGEAFQQISRANPARASEEFSKSGVPGLRYLDAGSRGAGDGTSNYVVFDDALVEIMKRNGRPLKAR